LLPAEQRGESVVAAQFLWRPLVARYDDGGFSGGNLERPALRRLLDDIGAGKVDTVVVYKVDRLTRSLADFAKIVEQMDAKGVSFVSVTQAFNTTTSMGRLTLNVLLSFAQFEREVTGERIRDKIAASKAKGMWMGGNRPLGYDTEGRSLVINEAEAATVKLVFERYLALGSVHVLAAELEAQDIRSKTRGLLTRGPLFHILRNRIYLGEIIHKGQAHPGLHPAIIDSVLFDAVQAKLDANKVRRARRAKKALSPLTGRLFDADGAPMSPSFSVGQSRAAYRYYVSSPLVRGRPPTPSPDAIRRVPAEALEAFVLGRLQAVDPAVVSQSELAERVRRVSLRDGSVRIEIAFPADRVRDRIEREAVLAQAPSGDEASFEGPVLHLTAPVRMKFRGGRTWLDVPDGVAGCTAPQVDRSLVAGLRRAHAVLAEHAARPQSKPDELIRARCPASPYLVKLLRLAMLAPDIQRAILEGRQRRGLTLQQLLDAEIPASWVEQRTALGFAAG